MHGWVSRREDFGIVVNIATHVDVYNGEALLYRSYSTFQMNSNCYNTRAHLKRTPRYLAHSQQDGTSHESRRGARPVAETS